MKKILMCLAVLCLCTGAMAQLKPRPDAFPLVDEDWSTKAVSMAGTPEEMASWDRYPTYETYLAMMQRWAAEYPQICSVDTIGLSINGRLILSMHIEGGDADAVRPQFFYSSTIHGDEVTGYVMMLHLIDTLLSSYGTSEPLTDLVNSVAIYINPLSNPDGTYYVSNATVQGSRRYNARGVDLNRNYPDPFGTTKEALQPENEAMIEYVSNHRFRMSANLHGGSEVMNYPWDCFTSLQNPHPESAWWQEVCRRFVDTARVYGPSHFRDVNTQGWIAGGDWYVIHGGRQDYMNYYHDCLELTMELSTQKTLSSNRLPEYWNFLAPSLINYIREVLTLPGSVDVPTVDAVQWVEVYPNPVATSLTVTGLTAGATVKVVDLTGRVVATALSHGATANVDVTRLPAGIYLLKAEGRVAKFVKR